MPPAVVVDTMIASAWLGRRDSPRKTRWQPSLEGLAVLCQLALLHGHAAARRLASGTGGYPPGSPALHHQGCVRAGRVEV
jgi:hypothetical protein